MTIVIMQPGYLPWLGFFELMYRSDVFVVYDNVQYDKNGWRNRNRIKTPQGAQWLTVPVHSKDKPRISEVKIDNTKNWAKKHLKILESNYQRAPYFEEYFEKIKDILSKEWEKLLDLDLYLIENISELLGINRRMVLVSDLKIKHDDRVGRLIEICKQFDAQVFYEPAGGKGYLDSEKNQFEKEGIGLVFQNFECPKYSQLFGDFIPGLSIVDLLFNEGENSLNFIIQGGK